jgi:hypothetical protein
MTASVLRRRSFVAACLFVTAALGGCLSSSPTPPPAAVAAIPITSDALVGKWGLASYHNDADKARTQAAALEQCNKPYVIAKGPNGGVMMHIADQAQPEELFVKAGPDGRTYLGPPGQAGAQADREVLSFDNGVMIAKWVDPDAASRYGTMIYARCKAKTS